MCDHVRDVHLVTVCVSCCWSLLSRLPRTPDHSLLSVAALLLLLLLLLLL